MTIELKIYENPVLTPEVKPGLVLEALPGSHATLKSLYTLEGLRIILIGVILQMYLDM